MSETYERGAMDITTKVRSYQRFVGGVRLVAFAFAVIISFLLVTFCGGGFGAGLFVAIVELVVGVYVGSRRARTGSAEPEVGLDLRAQGDVEAQAANRNTRDRHAA